MQYFFDPRISKSIGLAKKNDFMQAATLLMEHEHRISNPVANTNTFEEVVGIVLRLMDTLGSTEIALKENTRRKPEDKQPVHELLEECNYTIEQYEELLEKTKELHLIYHLEKT